MEGKRRSIFGKNGKNGNKKEKTATEKKEIGKDIIETLSCLNALMISFEGEVFLYQQEVIEEEYIEHGDTNQILKKYWGQGIATETAIASLNYAFEQLKTKPDLALIDGNKSPKLNCKTQTIIGGDAKSLSIAAASIIAKVTRDRIMHQLDLTHPNYGFARHNGYGTAAHAAALAIHGPCDEHRKSFKPIALILDRSEL